jgi:hypothetical protein
MPVTIMCPNLLCKKILAVPTAARGTKVQCAYCGTMLLVPAAKPPVRRSAEQTLPPAADQPEKKKGKRVK